MGTDLISSPGAKEQVYSGAAIAKKYLQYYLTAANGKGHGAHSPFVFTFITRLLNDKQEYPEYTTVEMMRRQMLADRRTIQVEDYGAGSGAGGNQDTKRVSAIAKHAAKPRKYGQLLFRMVKAWKPKTILELGTSLGLTTAYLSLGNPGSRLVTIEGSKEIGAIARANLDKLGIANASVLQGPFDDKLPEALDQNPEIDFVFIDGNHRYEPTLRYFQQLLPVLDNDSVVVFDDIHWSAGMEKAWEEIKSRPEVTCSIDLFFIGVVFFRKEFMAKQHFTIRF